jgi:hypothetical protein
VTIRGKLNGTNTGTSAPLTAPFFGRFWGSTGWRNRCMAVLPGMPATVQLMCCRNHAASERKACCFIADIDGSRLTCEVLALRRSGDRCAPFGAFHQILVRPRRRCA